LPAPAAILLLVNPPRRLEPNRTASQPCEVDCFGQTPATRRSPLSPIKDTTQCNSSRIRSLWRQLCCSPRPLSRPPRFRFRSAQSAEHPPRVPPRPQSRTSSTQRPMRGSRRSSPRSTRRDSPTRSSRAARSPSSRRPTRHSLRCRRARSSRSCFLRTKTSCARSSRIMSCQAASSRWRSRTSRTRRWRALRAAVASRSQPTDAGSATARRGSSTATSAARTA